VPAHRPAPAASDAIEPLKRLLLARFPEARFDFRQAPDGLRCYLDVATNCDDDFAVLEAVAGPALDLFVQHGVMVHVFPFRYLPDDGRGGEAGPVSGQQA
jgi:hypothetical protein